ncbi:mediator of RNA polymerase II transcription subunit 1-like [Spea bombifrons]|uniref:mediator of RNA polymerase II transcription subunit 1-like n=1 Tax=Spea bombifrons TaxID=233779 RepID=UPI00234AB687|nr:mediator of RNA polymerase II transcription subunit 1-like [Spea bombifrons]
MEPVVDLTVEENCVDLAEEKPPKCLLIPENEIDKAAPDVLPVTIEHQERKPPELVPPKQTIKTLLEKLHHKYAMKPWTETFRLVRYCLDKPVGNYLKDTLDHPLLKCQGMLQDAVKAKSLSAILTRIESISKQKGLESHLAPNGRICYITSEMFYIEIQVKKSGKVEFVKLAHHGEAPKNCREMLQFLRIKDFESFGMNLEGLLNLYNIPGNSETKAKVYLALQCLEADLYTMLNMGRLNANEDRVTAILHGPVGHITARNGGTPLNIEYYISPSQILEEKLKPGTCVVGAATSVTVAGTKNYYHLPVSPLINESQQEGRSIPVFTALTDDLNLALPACFFLMFSEPVPLILSFIHMIQNITGLSVFGIRQSPLHELLIQMTTKPNGAQEVCKEPRFIKVYCEHVKSWCLWRSVPDSMDQCYYIYSSMEECALMGASVNKIPFTHPSHVPQILELLRQQAAYNALVCSCISNNRKTKDSGDLLHFEVLLQLDCRISISFQHPTGSSLCCVSIDVNSRQLRSNIYTSALDPPFPCSSEFITQVMERCMSIPITMRTIFKRAEKEKTSQEMTISGAVYNQSALSGGLMESSQCMPNIVQHGRPQEIQSSFENNNLCVSLPNTTHNDNNSMPDCKGAMESNTQEFSSTNVHDVHDTNFSTGHVDAIVAETYSTIAEHSSAVIIPKQDSVTVQDLSPIPTEHPSHMMAEGLSPIMAEDHSLVLEDHSPMITEEQNPSVAEKLSSSFAEEPSSSFTGELSSSITEELSLSVTGLMAPGSVPENETNDFYEIQ